MAQQLWSKYCDLLVTRPLITKGLTGGTLFAIGDLLAQKLDGTLDTTGYNPKRSLIGFCWSSCIFTPIGHTWYAKIFPRYLPQTTTQHTIAKVALDQLCFSSVINTLYLSYTTTAHRGEFNLAAIKAKWDADFWTILKANWSLWVPVQFISLKFIPIPLQMPFLNVVVLFWSAYLATMSAKHHAHPEEEMDTMTHAAEALEIIQHEPLHIPPSQQQHVHSSTGGIKHD